MGSRWLVLAAAWALAIGFVSAAGASAPPAGTEASIRADLKAGRAFVLVLIDQRDKKLLASEAYADWHAYFGQFRERNKSGPVKLYTLAPAAGRALLRGALDKTVGNATLFVDAKAHALLHKGLVLEPEVYVLGTRFIETGSAAGEAASYGLVEVELK